MINQIRGILREVGEEKVTLTVGPFDLEVLIPGNAMRPLQGKVDEMIFLHTIFYIEGNQLSGRMAPRLVGFLTELDLEFFEILCSVDGMGVRKSLRAMARPVREIARLIQDRDVKLLSTFPGIGEAMAERIVAKIRRKAGKFALIVAAGSAAEEGAASNGHPTAAEPDVIQDTFAALLSVGHSESQARELIDRALVAGKRRRKFSSVPDLIEAIYRVQDEEAAAKGSSQPDADEA